MYKTILIPLFLCSLVPVSIQAEEKKDDRPPYYLTDEELDKKLGVDGSADENTQKAPDQFVWVVYFHRVPGCDTCQLMSKYVYETIDTRFSDDVKVKDIVLRYRNFEEKKNADLVKKLNIKSPSLAIMIVKNGKLSKAKLAGKIWSLASDKKKFMDYVEEEINAYKSQLKDDNK